MRRPLLVFTLALALPCGCMPPSWGAAALLHPARRPVGPAPALAHEDVAFESDGVVLRGWRLRAAAPSRDVTVVYLHGSGDNRASGVWIAERLVRRGYEVLAYDGRAHGESGGDACTYGYHEREDLHRALDALGIGRAILVGVSLGGAVALQAAAEDPRVVGVVSVATFSDLESVARDRAPFFASEGQIREAFALAEREGRFRVTEVSPMAAASRIRVPTLLVHGEEDRETRPAHSDRVYAALAGPRRMLRVEGTGHEDVASRAWPKIEPWVDLVTDAVSSAPGGNPLLPEHRGD